MNVCKFVVGVLLLGLALEIPVEAASRPVASGLNAQSSSPFHLVRRRRRKKKPTPKKPMASAVQSSATGSV